MMDSKRLGQALARYGRWVWSGVRRLRAAKQERNEEASRSVARARFWAELREGQREAAARRPKLPS